MLRARKERASIAFCRVVGTIWTTESGGLVIGSAPLQSLRSILSSRKPRVGFIRCRWACEGWTRNYAARIYERFLITRPVLNPDRRPNKPKRRAYLVLKKPLVRKVQLHRAIGEEHEHRRRYSRLRHVEDFHALAHRNGSAFKVNRPQEPIHLSGGDAFAALCCDLLDQRQNFFCPLASMRGEKKHRSISQKLEPVAQALFVESTVLRALGILDASRLRLADGALLAARHQIPFIDQNNHRASALVGIACDVSVQSAGAFGGIHHEEHDVGVFNILARNALGKLLRHQPRLPLAPNARRINETNLAAFV